MVQEGVLPYNDTSNDDYEDNDDDALNNNSPAR
jgi:hypothetical protein